MDRKARKAAPKVKNYIPSTSPKTVPCLTTHPNDQTTKCACGLWVAAAAAATIRLLNAAGFSDPGVISSPYPFTHLDNPPPHCFSSFPASPLPVWPSIISTNETETT